MGQTATSCGCNNTLLDAVEEQVHCMNELQKNIYFVQRNHS